MKSMVKENFDRVLLFSLEDLLLCHYRLVAPVI